MGSIFFAKNIKDSKRLVLRSKMSKKNNNENFMILYVKPDLNLDLAKPKALVSVSVPLPFIQDLNKVQRDRQRLANLGRELILDAFRS
jgi:hypothetical protein